MLMISILVESLDQEKRRRQVLLVVEMSSSSTSVVTNQRPRRSNQLQVEEISWICSEALI